MKTWLKVLLALLLVVAVAGAYVYSQFRSIDVEQLDEDLWVLRCLGGNTTVLRTSAGTVVVDTMTFGMQGERIRDIATELAGQPPVMIINTHYHFDHTHGNPAFEKGTRVLSTDRTLAYLNALDAEFWQGDAAHLLPSEPFTDQQTLSIGGKTIELIHPGPGHTDGDLVVLITDEGVLHTGDLMFNHHYPNIDLEAGGTVQGWPQTLDRILAMDFTRVVPGHGATTDRAGIQAFQAFITQLGEIGQEAASTGATLEATQATTELTTDAGYEPIVFIVPLGLDRNFVLGRAWEEATGNFQLHELAP
jgi:cyclase